jgi:ATP-dependent RNA helicase DDX24/MAK5
VVWLFTGSDTNKKREQVKDQQAQLNETETDGEDEEEEWGGITIESIGNDNTQSQGGLGLEPSHTKNQVQDSVVDIGTVDPEWLSLSLDPWLLKGLSEQGFSKPTPIQSQSIPFALQNRDVIGVAQTVCFV